VVVAVVAHPTTNNQHTNIISSIHTTTNYTTTNTHSHTSTTTTTQYYTPHNTTHTHHTTYLPTHHLPTYLLPTYTLHTSTHHTYTAHRTLPSTSHISTLTRTISTYPTRRIQHDIYTSMHATHEQLDLAPQQPAYITPTIITTPELSLTVINNASQRHFHCQ
jgi:hypothetical protein